MNPNIFLAKLDLGKACNGNGKGCFRPTGLALDFICKGPECAKSISSGGVESGSTALAGSLGKMDDDSGDSCYFSGVEKMSC